MSHGRPSTAGATPSTSLAGAAYAAATVIDTPGRIITVQFDPGTFDANDDVIITNTASLYIVGVMAMVSTTEAISIALFSAPSGAPVRLSGDVSTASQAIALEAAGLPAAASRAVSGNIYVHASGNPVTLVGTIIIIARRNV